MRTLILAVIMFGVLFSTAALMDISRDIDSMCRDQISFDHVTKECD